MPACTHCHRTDGTHTDGCAKNKGCRLCARRAPDKCPYHGGERRSYVPKKKRAGGGKHRAKKPERAVAERAPSSTNGALALLIDTLEEELVQKRAEVRVLDAMLVKARAGA